MKLTKQKLKQIIKEELRNLLRESDDPLASPGLNKRMDHLRRVAKNTRGTVPYSSQSEPEADEHDIVQQDQLGAAAVLPGRIQAAQSALDSLRGAINPPSSETKVAIGDLVKALNDQGYTVQFPASSIRDVGVIEPTE